MSNQKTIKELPACPVETTLTLIGNKWKVYVTYLLEQSDLAN